MPRWTAFRRRNSSSLKRSSSQSALSSLVEGVQLPQKLRDHSYHGPCGALPQCLPLFSPLSFFTEYNGVLPAVSHDMALQILALVPRQHWPALRLVSESWKRVLDSRDLLETRKSAGIADTFLYVIGKSMSRQKLLALDIQQSRWYTVGDLPSESHERLSDGSIISSLKDSKVCPLMGFELVSVDRGFLLLGGQKLCMSNVPATMDRTEEESGRSKARPGGTWRYDAVYNKWYKGRNMLAGSRSYFAQAVLNGKVYVAGGHSVAGVPLQSAEVYDPDCDKWQLLPPMPTLNEANGGRCTGASVGSLFYVFGVTLGGVLKVIAIFDVVASTWQMPGLQALVGLPLFQPTPVIRAVPIVQNVVIDGKVYFTRGAPEDALGWSDRDIRLFDPATNTWSVAGRLPPMPGLSREWEVTRQAFSISTVGAKMYVVGGVAWARLFGCTEVQSIQVLDPLCGLPGGSWQSTGHYEEELFLGSVWKSIAVSV